jgi:hypothetical protein
MNRRNFIQSSTLASFGLISTPAMAAFGGRSLSDDHSIRKVHLIFKTHLDIGFTNLAAKVIRIYMDEFIPGALSLSENLRQKNQKDRFVWTTGSWLIYEFLEKADPAMRKRMEKAIQNGDIVWHGLPFTLHSELADPSLYDLGIQLSVALDKRFGKKTISAKMTDVPGHTRAIVPILQKNGLEFLHIGVNPASMPPDVPPLFVWQAPDGAEVMVMYQKDYGSQMIIPGTHTAIAICFTSDNHGPQKPEQIAGIYSDLRKQFPNAEVSASTFNAVASEVSLIRKQLPVITQELGDTWIHGIGSDPTKIAKFREVSRLRNKWLKDKTLKFADATDIAFGIPLLMVAEHTWGLDVKTFLADWNIYKPADFNAARSKPNFKLMEQSWNEKRQYINDAIDHLPVEKASEAKLKIESLKPVPVEKAHFIKIGNLENEIDTPFFQLQIDKTTGGIIKLKDKQTGIDWANPGSMLCLFSYQTFSSADYDRYLGQYLTQKTEWALGDFGKTGQEVAGAISRTWLPTLKEAFIQKDSNGQNILLHLVIVDQKGASVGGSPRNITVELTFPNKTKEMQVTLQWFNKPAYRPAEASWFSFIPPVQNGDWDLDKMGQWVNSRDVIKNGNRKLHATQTGVRYRGDTRNCSISSLDAPLVAPGERTLLNFDNRLPNADEGVHFCLHNNVWGTNFVMWFEDDMKYRFVFKV